MLYRSTQRGVAVVGGQRTRRSALYERHADYADGDCTAQHHCVQGDISFGIHFAALRGAAELSFLFWWTDSICRTPNR